MIKKINLIHTLTKLTFVDGLIKSLSYLKFLHFYQKNMHGIEAIKTTSL